MGHWWDEEKTLWLLTPEEFKGVHKGTKLTSINGDTVIKGKDKIDNDTRFGHLAYGVTRGQKLFPSTRS